MAAVSSLSVSKLLQTSQARWAVSGWAFFVAENALLSENRTYLIQQLGDDRYHLVYGTLSTVATASIAYSYYYLTRKSPVLELWKQPPMTDLVTSWMNLTLGLIMASQALPKMQIPVNSQFQVRCPFDFTDRHSEDKQLHGLERITRHPGLWSLATVGIGLGALQSNAALRLWWCGPTAVAVLGGAHTDSRYRRGMGGQLDPIYDSMTSNLPFVAVLSGRQGSVSNALGALMEEIKPLNAAVAAGVATVWVASRGRVKVKYV